MAVVWKGKASRETCAWVTVTLTKYKTKKKKDYKYKRSERKRQMKNKKKEEQLRWPAKLLCVRACVYWYEDLLSAQAYFLPLHMQMETRQQVFAVPFIFFFFFLNQQLWKRSSFVSSPHRNTTSGRDLVHPANAVPFELKESKDGHVSPIFPVSSLERHW